MKKRQLYEIVLFILIIIVVVNSAFIILTDDTADKEKAQKNQYNVTKIGENENGTVYKIVAGNLSSNDTVGLILGVHPREHEIHDAVNNTIYNITGDNGTNNLTKKYVIYFVKVKDNITSREDTRPAGENLANQFVVPNIKADNPFIVIDIHEIDENYEYSNFIFPLSNNTISKEYADNLSKELDVAYYNFTEGTSPEKVTKPIASQGINTLLFETSIKNSLHEKDDMALKIIRACDSLKAWFFE